MYYFIDDTYILYLINYDWFHICKNIDDKYNFTTHL
jgi:hypothetical protein